jgi:cytochrome P450
MPRRAALRPRAEEIAAGLLEEMAATHGDVIDLLDRYARPLPVAVISLCPVTGSEKHDRAPLDENPVIDDGAPLLQRRASGPAGLPRISAAEPNVPARPRRSLPSSPLIHAHRRSWRA